MAGALQPDSSVSMDVAGSKSKGNKEFQPTAVKQKTTAASLPTMKKDSMPLARKLTKKKNETSKQKAHQPTLTATTKLGASQIPKAQLPTGLLRRTRRASSSSPPSSSVPRSKSPAVAAKQHIRLTSLRQPEPLPVAADITPENADKLCRDLTARVWNENLGKMFDRVVDADSRGCVDDKLYSDLLDFFYCFLPVSLVFPLSVYPVDHCTC